MKKIDKYLKRKIDNDLKCLGKEYYYDPCYIDIIEEMIEVATDLKISLQKDINRKAAELISRYK